MEITIVVAVAENGVIGSEDRPIPWRLDDDVQRYREYSKSRPVIVGRVTRELVGFQHSDELEVVLSRNPEYQSESSIVARSIQEAINLTDGYKEVVVLGGGQVYAQFLPICTKIIMTMVHTNPHGDVYFHYPQSDWREVRRQWNSASEGNEYPFSFVQLEPTHR